MTRSMSRGVQATSITYLCLFLLACNTTAPSYELSGGERFGRLPPCQPPYQTTNCEMAKYLMSYSPEVRMHFWEVWEVNSAGQKHGLYTQGFAGGEPNATWCYENGTATAIYFPGIDIHHGELQRNSHQEVMDECNPPTMTKLVMTAPTRTPEDLQREADERLSACDSFGFERGTEGHAKCAMNLYMSDRQQRTSEGSGTQMTTQANSVVMRQQAIDEARRRELQRLEGIKASLQLMQTGLEIMNGTTPSQGQSQGQSYSQTYNIEGELITCNTVGTLTTCR